MSIALAREVLAGLAQDPDAIAELRKLLVVDGATSEPAAPVAYTVARLAAELQVTERKIRAAIMRGELQAVKRGRLWVITPEAVKVWSAPPAQAKLPRRAAPRRRRGGTEGSLAAHMQELGLDS